MNTQTIQQQGVNNDSLATKQKIAFAFLCFLFALWAIPNGLNSLFMPQLQLGFQMSNFQTSFIAIAKSMGYFIVPIAAAKFQNKYGFKATLSLGLAFFVVGFAIAGFSLNNYILFSYLLGLVIVFGGAGIIEISANPLATLLGEEKYASVRINTAQIFNMVSSFLTAYIGGKVILGSVQTKSPEQLATLSSQEVSDYHHSLVASGVSVYVFMFALILIAFIVLKFIKFPSNKELGDAGGVSEGYFATLKRVLKVSHFKWALIAMFCMNATQDSLVEYFIRFAALKENTSLSNVSSLLSILVLCAVAGRIIGTIIMKKVQRDNMVLGYFMLFTVIASLCAVVLPGKAAIISVMAAFFFLAPSYPTIFALGIKGLGKDTKIASTFMVMMIIGAGFGPAMFGLVADHFSNFSIAYIIPALLSSVIVFFAFKKAA